MPSLYRSCRSLSIVSLALLMIGLSGFAFVQAESPSQQNKDRPIFARPDAIETIFSGKELHEHPLQDANAHDHPHCEHHGLDDQGFTIIHLTDYLYRVPEIKQAYEAWLSMKKESPHRLKVMEDPVEYEVGDTKMFYVYNLEESTPGSAVYDEILFELRSTGEKTEIWVEQEELAPGKIDDNVVKEMMEALEERTPERSVNPDQGIILNNIDIFAEGNPDLVPDPDGSGKVKILICDIQDGFDPEGEDRSYTAGFFNPGDLSPRTAHPKSNEAAILYINSYPGIYTDDQPADPRRPLSTVAHEHQHLIQAGRGNLITFMDEGQSEVAEIFNGFNARSMVFLNDPEEVSGNVESGALQGFFRWRTGEREVLNDYQRAQLFHSYLYERVGVEATGSLTQSAPGNPWTQYQRILNQAEPELEFREVLAGFYVANRLNDKEYQDGIFGYSLPQLSGVRVSHPGRRFDPDDRPWVSNEQVVLRYGGAKYTNWHNVSDLSIQLDTPSEIIHHLITTDDDGTTDVTPMENPGVSLSGMYHSVTLVSVNTVVQSSANFGSRQFHYTAEWTPSDLRIVDISYANFSDHRLGYFPLPYELSSDRIFKGISVRVDPEHEGTLQGVDFHLTQTEEAVQGEGVLNVSLRESERASGTGPDAVYVPSESIASLDIDFEELQPSVNAVDFSDFDVHLEAEKNYHFFFRVRDASEDAELRFLFDQGSDDTGDTNYYPVRTLLAGFDQEEHFTGWSRLLGDEDDPDDNDNKNMLMTTLVLSRVPLDNKFPEIAVSDNFKLLPNYPNPFNEGTQIRFNIPVNDRETTRVRIDIYDVTGRQVARLVDENLQAGVHTVPFEAGNLASGIYITRMQAGDTVDARKITFVK